MIDYMEVESMVVKPNRLLMSNTDVYKIINSQANTKLDLSFMDKSNIIKVSDIKTDIDLIKTRNMPLMRQVVDAVESGKIVLCRTNNVGSSIVYVFGSKNGGNSIDTVFVNITRFSKIEKGVTATGEMVNKPIIIGGYEVLYNVLIGAYMGLNVNRVFLGASVVNKIREIYTDLFAQIISRNFGNVIDGEKFRFMVAHYFFNGELLGNEVAQLTRFQLDKAAALASQYPEWYNSRETKSLAEFINILVQEFPSLGRRNLSPESFVISTVASLGDNAVYMIDNFAYLVAVITAKARRSKVFAGYMLKSIESDSTQLLSALYQSVM